MPRRATDTPPGRRAGDKPKGPQLDQRKKLLLLGAAAVAVVAVFLIRRNSSSVATVPAASDPNAIDPATGLTYAQEAAGGAGAASGGSTGAAGGTDYSGAISALSSQFDNLASYANGLGQQQAADEATLSGLGVAIASSAAAPGTVAPASSTTPAAAPPTGKIGAANTPGARPAAVAVPKTVAPGPYQGGAAVVAVTHPNPKTTITTTATGARIEQVAGHTPYRVSPPKPAKPAKTSKPRQAA